MENSLLLKAQNEILRFVADRYKQVYLVGGTALSSLYHHRMSEDLDFFTQKYTRDLHKAIARDIKLELGFPFKLIEEEKRKNYLPMAIYEFKLGQKSVLKVDFVKDRIPLIHPRPQNGIASIDDLYYRKMMTAVGWKAGESVVGKALAGGRQKTKDLFDIFYLSTQVKPLSEWFPKYFQRDAYERLASWHFSIPKQKTLLELMDLVPGCDTKAIFKHLDQEIIYKLNRAYASL